MQIILGRGQSKNGIVTSRPSSAKVQSQCDPANHMKARRLVMFISLCTIIIHLPLTRPQSHQYWPQNFSRIFILYADEADVCERGRGHQASNVSWGHQPVGICLTWLIRNVVHKLNMSLSCRWIPQLWWKSGLKSHILCLINRDSEVSPGKIRKGAYASKAPSGESPSLQVNFWTISQEAILLSDLKSSHLLNLLSLENSNVSKGIWKIGIFEVLLQKAMMICGRRCDKRFTVPCPWS